MKSATCLRALVGMFFCAAALVGPASISQAGFIQNYGNVDDIPPGTIMYQNVTESTVTDNNALYGPPEVQGNTMDFDPAAFGAFGANGTIDFTDGFLSFRMMAIPGTAIQGFAVNEGGAFTTFGGGPTWVQAGLLAIVKIFEVDGVALNTPLTLPTFTANFNHSVADGQAVLQPWSLNMPINLVAALVNNGIPFTRGVTKLEVAVDNGLLANSAAPNDGAPGGIAFIDKKDFQIITRIPDQNEIPEPATLVLVALAAAGFAGLRARR